MSNFKKSFGSILASLLVAGGLVAVAAQIVRAEGNPEIFTISPAVGPFGQQITLTGKNFGPNPTVHWGFGSVKTFATGSPAQQTIVFNIVPPRCEETDPQLPCAVPQITPGPVSIVVTNSGGVSSNAKKFILAAHTSPNGCYFVNEDDYAKPVSCDDATCNTGSCKKSEATPQPNPTVTPKPTPTPTPVIIYVEKENDDDEESGGGSSGSSGSSKGTVAGTTATTTKKPGFAPKAPTAAQKNAPDFISNKNVPATVARIYKEVYGQDIVPEASKYWKLRARGGLWTAGAVRDKMAYYKSIGKNPGLAIATPAPSAGRVAGATTSNDAKCGLAGVSPSDKMQVPFINRLFRTARNCQNPTPAQNEFYQKHPKIKSTVADMLGAMQYHGIAKTGF